jgi:hypothetical protein
MLPDNQGNYNNDGKFKFDAITPTISNDSILNPIWKTDIKSEISTHYQFLRDILFIIINGIIVILITLFIVQPMAQYLTTIIYNNII